MKYLNFYKTSDNRWWIDLPEWEGDKGELQMILGADSMLDMLCYGDMEVTISISLEPFNGYAFELNRGNEENEGYWYNYSDNYIDFNVWLCHVTKFVFGNFPKTIYGK